MRNKVSLALVVIDLLHGTMLVEYKERLRVKKGHSLPSRMTSGRDLKKGKCTLERRAEQYALTTSAAQNRAEIADPLASEDKIVVQDKGERGFKAKVEDASLPHHRTEENSYCNQCVLL